MTHVINQSINDFLMIGIYDDGLWNLCVVERGTAHPKWWTHTHTKTRTDTQMHQASSWRSSTRGSFRTAQSCAGGWFVGWGLLCTGLGDMAFVRPWLPDAAELRFSTIQYWCTTDGWRSLCTSQGCWSAHGCEVCRRFWTSNKKAGATPWSSSTRGRKGGQEMTLLAQLAAWQLSTLKRSSKLVKLAFGCRICIFPPGPSWLWAGPCFFQTAKKISRMFFFGSGMSSYVWLFVAGPWGHGSRRCIQVRRQYIKRFCFCTCDRFDVFRIVHFPDTQPSLHFVMGIACILISIHLYSLGLTSQAQSRTWCRDFHGQLLDGTGRKW